MMGRIIGKEMPARRLASDFTEATMENNAPEKTKTQKEREELNYD